MSDPLPFIDAWALASIAGIAQGILLGVAFLATWKSRNLAQRLLAVLILCIAFNLIHHVLVYTRYMLVWPHFLGVGNATTYAIGPLLYFYARTFSNSHFTFRKIDLVHALPFVGFQLMRVSDYLDSAAAKVQFLEAYYLRMDGGAPFISLSQHLSDLLVFKLHPLLYLGAALWVLQQVLKESNRSQTELRKVRRVQVILGSFVLWILHLPLFGIIHEVYPLSFYGRPLSLAVLILQIYLIAYLVVKHAASVLAPHVPDPKYQGSSLSSEEIRQKAKRLQEHMQTHKPYTNPTITLQALAAQVDLPVHTVSRIINEHMGQHFTEFINSYRVEAAKTLLVSPEYAHFTIEAISQAAGFNSRNTFYRAFRKQCGMTPTAYRRSQTVA